MANQNRKNLKIRTLEQQVESRNKRIEYLQKHRKNASKNKQQEPSISDNLFLDLFSFFKLG